MVLLLYSFRTRFDHLRNAAEVQTASNSRTHSSHSSRLDGVQKTLSGISSNLSLLPLLIAVVLLWWSGILATTLPSGRPSDRNRERRLSQTPFWIFTAGTDSIKYLTFSFLLLAGLGVGVIVAGGDVQGCPRRTSALPTGRIIVGIGSSVDAKTLDVAPKTSLLGDTKDVAEEGPQP